MSLIEKHKKAVQGYLTNSHLALETYYYNKAEGEEKKVELKVGENKQMAKAYREWKKIEDLKKLENKNALLARFDWMGSGGLDNALKLANDAQDVHFEAYQGWIEEGFAGDPQHLQEMSSSASSASASLASDGSGGSVVNAYFLEASRGSYGVKKPTWLKVDQLISWLGLEGSTIPCFEIMPGDIRPIYEKDEYQLVSAEDYKRITDKLISMYVNNYANKWVDQHADFPEVPLETVQKFQAPDLEKADGIFLQKVDFPDNARIFIIGDIHSSLTSLTNILRQMKTKHRAFKDDTFQLKSHVYMVFLGDMVDRGPYGVEIITLVSQLKSHNFNQVFIVNGNHEDSETYLKYGFAHETAAQIDGQSGVKSLTSQAEKIEQLQRVLHFFPSAIFGTYLGKRYQFCHGAITENEYVLKAVNRLFSTGSNGSLIAILGPNPEETFKWGDMANIADAKTMNARRPNFGYPKIEKYLAENEITAILSGHQDTLNLSFITPGGILNPKLMESTTFKNSGFWNLYRPKGYLNLKMEEPYPYVPGQDFIALNTSTCYMTKSDKKTLKCQAEEEYMNLKSYDQLHYDHYLILSHKPDPKVLEMIEANEDY